MKYNVINCYCYNNLCLKMYDIDININFNYKHNFFE